MNRILLWDAAPGEIRLMLHEDCRLVELRLLRLLNEAPLLAGKTTQVRLGTKIGARRALVQYDGGEGEISPIPDCTEGSWLTAELIRIPFPEPGRWKRAVFRQAEAREFGFGDYILSQWPELTAIVCAGPIEATQVRSILGDACPEIQIDKAAIDDAQSDIWCERGITGEFVIEGGLLSIERTRAMTMIDIDGFGAAHAVNLAAARTIPWLLRLYGIGGQVGIDFLASANKAERAEIDAELGKACATLSQLERTAVSGFGFAQLVLPRPGPSVMEMLCGTGWKAPSVETQALMLLREAARSQGVGARELVANADIIAQIERWPALLEELRSSLGCAITLRCDSSQNGYGHVHVSP
jgi:Ribonuclease E/G family